MSLIERVPRAARVVPSVAILLLLGGGSAGAQFLAPSPQVVIHTAFRYQLAEGGDWFGLAMASGDFNGDGRDDLAIAAPGEDEGPALDAGAVSVALGTPNGLRFDITPTLLHTWNGSPDVEGGDLFGEALASGDFDGDGFDDLAVGVQGDDSAAANSGVVNVYYGGTGNIGDARIQEIAQGRDGMAGEREERDWFGSELAVGDFNGDSYADLAIGVPGEGIGTWSAEGKGAVQVLYGSPAGLVVAFDNFFHQEGLTDGGDSEPVDSFGSALAAGDFDGDGYDDLAVGVPNEDVDGISNCGAVNVIYGAIGGLDRQRSKFFWQNSSPTLGGAESGDMFARSLAAGDINGDGRDDLAVGVPYEDLENLAEAGAVSILWGAAGGLTATGGLFLHQGSPGVTDASEAQDYFGGEVVLRDFDRDGRAELFVGIWGENGTGAYQRFSGSAAGLVLSTSLLRFQPGQGAQEAGDQFGMAIELGDFDGNGRQDLAVAAPSENLAHIQKAGQVDVTYSAPPQVIGFQ